MLGRDTSGYEMQTTTTTNNNFREKNQFFLNFASVIHIHIYIYVCMYVCMYVSLKQNIYKYIYIKYFR